MIAKPIEIVVVGGGLAGLSAAVETAALRHRGASVRVTLVERNAHLGGKMNVLDEAGFRFDMGPTIITIPEVLRGIVRRAAPEARLEDYIDLRPCDPQWRCFFEDGTKIDVIGDADAMTASIERQFPGSGPGFARFVDFSRRMLRLSEKVFFFKDVGSALDLMRLAPMGDRELLRDVLGMRMHSTVAGTVHGLVREPHVRQMLEHFLQYVGSSPFLSPAILSLIAAAQLDRGCWYPMGGTRQVARTLERLATELGVSVITGCGVRKIIQGPQRGAPVTGVELDDGRTLAADAVISNADVQRTLRGLVGTDAAQRKAAGVARRYRPACSGVVLYLGLSRQYEHLAHHNFLFSRDSDAEFADIYRAAIPARDPTLYLAVPSRSDSSQAPPGGEALYVLIHTPPIQPGQQWEGPGGLFERYEPVVMAKLRRFGMDDIDRHVVVRRHLHPGLIDRLYNAEGGAIYGLASHGRLHGGFKPRNRSGLAPNLYFAGGSVNPGPGVPMVLMSGVTAARALAEDLGLPAANDDAVALGAPLPALSVRAGAATRSGPGAVVAGGRN